MKNRFVVTDVCTRFRRSKNDLSKESWANRFPVFPLFTLFILVIFSITATAQSQPSSDRAEREREIRRLEAEQVEYLIQGKLAEMRKHWTADFTVNNPFNVVQDAATGPLQTGELTYSKFERNIEKVLHHDSVIIVMGNELVVPKTAPKDSSHETDQPITRRFTNIWMLMEGEWRMIARHANVICPK
jgi:hypothetical protein